MHLYIFRMPEMDLVWHLHPARVEAGIFTQDWPAMPAGRYGLYGDVVHRNGLPETVIADLDLPAVEGTPLKEDDSAGAGPPLSQADYNRIVSPLRNGYRMVWERPAAPLRTR